MMPWYWILYFWVLLPIVAVFVFLGIWKFMEWLDNRKKSTSITTLTVTNNVMAMISIGTTLVIMGEKYKVVDIEGNVMKVERVKHE